ncbi:hypothetical protein NCCP2222_25730 [Sporosarcina sp. NCCP-2222]|nr:hypothetical protein NCCP2222_25730 [Sporosarcina sp. NCCP-2222]
MNKQRKRKEGKETTSKIDASPNRFFVIHRSQTIYGSLVETFGPYFQVYTKKMKYELR